MRSLTALETDLRLFMRARSRRPRLCPANERSLSSVRPNCHCKPPPTSCHATLSAACRLRGDRHLLASLQDKQSRRRQKRQVTFLLFGSSMGRRWELLGQDCRIHVSWWVVDVYLQCCFGGFLVVACCEPHASSLILLMRRCCATS